MPITIIPLFLIGIMFISCQNTVTQECAIHNQYWRYRDTLHFKFNIMDTLKPYNLNIKVEHSNDYLFQNIWLKVRIKNPMDIINTTQINVLLADDVGKWHNEDIAIIPNIVLQKGIYYIEIVQDMRMDSLTHIKGIIVSFVKT